jgi:hypothetical protein
MTIFACCESLWDNPDFIQAGFHIGRYVTASVNIEAEREQIKALYSRMKTTSKLIEVSIYASLYILFLKLDPSLILVVVKHSQDKDQFLKVSIKRMQETQMYEDELKEANKYNSALFARLQELEAKCTKESQLKEGKFLSPFCLVNPIISEYTLDWSQLCLAEYKDQLMALGVIPDALGSEVKAFANLEADLDKEKVAQVVAQIEVDVLSRTVWDLQISTDRFATQIPTHEDKVKHKEDKVVEGLNEVRAQELCLERTTQANDDYQT